MLHAHWVRMAAYECWNPSEHYEYPRQSQYRTDETIGYSHLSPQKLCCATLVHSNAGALGMVCTLKLKLKLKSQALLMEQVHMSDIFMIQGCPWDHKGWSKIKCKYIMPGWDKLVTACRGGQGVLDWHIIEGYSWAQFQIDVKCSVVICVDDGVVQHVCCHNFSSELSLGFPCDSACTIEWVCFKSC